MTATNDLTKQPVRVHSDIHRALKVLAAHSGVSMSALAEQAIKSMLDRVGK